LFEARWLLFLFHFLNCISAHSSSISIGGTTWLHVAMIDGCLGVEKRVCVCEGVCVCVTFKWVWVCVMCVLRLSVCILEFVYVRSVKRECECRDASLTFGERYWNPSNAAKTVGLPPNINIISHLIMSWHGLALLEAEIVLWDERNNIRVKTASFGFRRGPYLAFGWHFKKKCFLCVY